LSERSIKTTIITLVFIQP